MLFHSAANMEHFHAIKKLIPGIGKAKQFDCPRVSIPFVFVLVVACKSKNVSFWMPSDSERWTLTRNVGNLFAFITSDIRTLKSLMHQILSESWIIEN